MNIEEISSFLFRSFDEFSIQQEQYLPSTDAMEIATLPKTGQQEQEDLVLLVDSISTLAFEVDLPSQSSSIYSIETRVHEINYLELGTISSPVAADFQQDLLLPSSSVMQDASHTTLEQDSVHEASPCPTLHSTAKKIKKICWKPREDKQLRSLHQYYSSDGNLKAGQYFWQAISSHFVDKQGIIQKTPFQCCQRWCDSVNPSISHLPWSKIEEEKLIQLVETHQAKWKVIAKHLPGRTSKQCRERWITSSNPAINHENWRNSEDEKLKRLHAKHGPKWSFIAKHFTNESGKIRNASQCKVRFRSVSKE